MEQLFYTTCYMPTDRHCHIRAAIVDKRRKMGNVGHQVSKLTSYVNNLKAVDIHVLSPRLLFENMGACAKFN